MSKLTKALIFGKNVKPDEREEKTIYEIYANAGIIAFIICICTITYDLIANKEITETGLSSLIITLIMTYYIMFMLKTKKVYLYHEQNTKSLLKNTFLTSFNFFSIFTLIMYLSGEKINIIKIFIYLILGISFGLCTYSWNKYNQKNNK